MTRMSVKENLDVELVPGFFKQAHRKESCGSLINTVLCIPGVHVLAVGPESCLRVIYFRALRQQQHSRLLLQPVYNKDLISNQHLDGTSIALQKMITDNNNDVKAVIIYISCCDILLGNDFGSTINCLEKQYQLPIKLFLRGPLAKRRVLPKERLSSLFCEILEAYRNYNCLRKSNNRGIINLLGEEKLPQDSELKNSLIQHGYKNIQEFADCRNFEDFTDLMKSSFNVVTDKFGKNIAEYLEKEFRTPYCFFPSKHSGQDLKNLIRSIGEAL